MRSWTVVVLVFIILCSCNLYSSQYGDTLFVRNIIYEGNKKTKISVLERELMFHPNDTLDIKQFDKYRELSLSNIKNLSLFNFVTIDTLHNYSNQNNVDLKINVVERWYFWPVPKINFADRNINAWFRTCDWSRINGGFIFTQFNMWGLNHTVELTTLYGYDAVIGLTYKIPFVDKRRTFGINVITEYTATRELPYITSTNSYIQYYHDSNKVSQKKQRYGLEFVIRPKYKTSHYVGLSYNQNKVIDTILKLNPNYSPDQRERTDYFNLYYMLKYDNRDYKHYTLKGMYVDVLISQIGLGLLNDEKGISVTSISSTIRKYAKLADRWHYGVGVVGRITIRNDQPYIFTNGLGSSRIELRGYENYAIDGTNYVLLKNNVKYTILKDRTFTINRIPEKWGKAHVAIYGNLFVDMGYVAQNYMQPIGIYNNKLLYSIGMGIDLVTYYDKVIRVDMTVNRDCKVGVYLHFTAPL